ncbi:MAG: YitT family protein [Phaeodactylibacter sp.]|nr:YitT family protein [Phaeodactylibacter sp.]
MTRRFVKTTVEYAQIALGILFTSIGLKAFLLPNGFLDGGLTGVALLISSKLDISLSLLLVLLSLPFLALAYMAVSRQVAMKSVVSIVGLALVIQFENFGPVTDDKLLIAIFGGLFTGMGIGLAIRNGAVLDGSEILGIYLNNYLGISIGTIILAFNIALFSLAAVLISVEVAMYSILAYLVTARITDMIIGGFEDFIGIMVVSEAYTAIQEEVRQQLGVGMTIYQGSQGFGKKGLQEQREIIHMIINRIDLRRVHRLIDQLDPQAFVTEYEVNNIKGGKLRRYLKPGTHQ